MAIQSETLLWKILLVEDDEDDYILTRDMLQEIRRGQFELTWVKNVDTAIQHLAESLPDAILVDYDLGARNGLELIHEIKARDEKIPIILYSGRGSYLLDVQAMQMGASDYLVKDEMNPRLLERSIRYAIAQKGVEEELDRRVRERTQDLARAVEDLQAENAERRRVEMMLSERDEMMRAILAGAPLLLWAVNRQGLVTMMEGKALGAIGVEPGQYVGRPVEEFLSQRPEIISYVQRALTGEEVIGIVQDVTESKEVFEARYSPLFDSRGEIAGVIGLAVQVTQRVRAEEQLREQKQRAELLVELSSRLAEVETDYQQLLDMVTSRTAELLGDFCSIFLASEDGQEIIPVSLHNRTRQAEPELWQALFTKPYPAGEGLVGRVIKTGEPLLIQDSSPEQIQALGRPEFSPFLQEHPVHSLCMVPLRSQGRTIGVLSVGREKVGMPFRPEDQSLLKDLAYRTTQAISNASLFRALQAELVEREKIEKALRSTSSFLESLIEASPDATLVIDPQGMIQRTNAEVELIFGYRADQLVGQRVEILLPDSLRLVHHDHRKDYSAKPTLRPMGTGMELYGRRQDGSYFPVDVKLSPILQDEEQYVIAVVRDISDRKAQEAELTEVQRLLMDSKERERLRIAQDIHDGPLQDLISITYRLQELRNQPPATIESEGLAEVKSAINTVSQELRTLCGDLRPPTLAPFGLERAIRSHAEEFQRAHPEFQLHLSLVADQQQLPENVRLALFRIYQQSLANVLRHSKAKQVMISLNLDAEQVYLEISDDGQGFDVPPRMIGLVRAGHLGLAGMYERAHAIAGRLTITSAPGQGTRIRVEAPRGSV